MSEARIRPIRDQVLVQLDQLERTTAGGIILPETARTSQGNRPDARWGVVLAVGPGPDTPRGRVPCSVKPGDRVLVNSWLNDSTSGNYGYGGRDDGDNVVMVQDKDIFAVEEAESREVTGPGKIVACENCGNGAGWHSQDGYCPVGNTVFVATRGPETEVFE